MLKSLSGQLGVDKDDYIAGTMYNGTGWVVSGIVVRMTFYTVEPTPDFIPDIRLVSTPCSSAGETFPSGAKVISVRDYLLNAHFKPLSANEVRERAGVILTVDENYSCQIISATGTH
jgi:hypothetical protein